MQLCSVFPGCFSDVFAPIPEERQLVMPPRRKGGWGHVATYLNTTSGAWDFFRVVEQVFESAKRLPFLSAASLSSLSRGSRVASLCGTSLSFPSMVCEMNGLKENVRAFIASRHENRANPFRRRMIVQAGRDVVLSGVNVTNAGAQAALFAHQAKLLNLAKALPVVDTIYQGTSIVGDGAELIKESYKLSTYEVAELDKKRLSQMVIAKDLVSIASAILALAVIFFAFSATVVAVITTVSFFFSLSWLALKVSSQFYGQVLQERHGV